MDNWTNSSFFQMRLAVLTSFKNHVINKEEKDDQEL